MAKSTSKPKLRFAPKFDRVVAREMVDALRVRLLSGTGRFNAKQNRDIPGVLTLGEVCHYLDQFGEFGTFGHNFSDPAHFTKIREAKIPREFVALRTTHSYEDAVAILAEKYDCVDRTVSNIIKAAGLEK
jgi:hypothetical protein